MPKIMIKMLHDDSKIPEKAHLNDIGWDVFVHDFWYYDESGECKRKENSIILESLDRVGCNLGFATCMPHGWHAHLAPRSGWLIKKGLFGVYGTIDDGFRGEWTYIVFNVSKKPITINAGDKIGQIIFPREECGENVEWIQVSNLPISDRGENGFGSSG